MTLVATTSKLSKQRQTSIADFNSKNFRKKSRSSKSCVQRSLLEDSRTIKKVGLVDDRMDLDRLMAKQYFGHENFASQSFKFLMDKLSQRYLLRTVRSWKHGFQQQREVLKMLRLLFNSGFFCHS